MPLLPASWTGFIVLSAVLGLFSGLALRLLGSRSLQTLPPRWRYLPLISAIVALLVRYPTSLPLFPVVTGETWVFFPFLFAAILLALLIWGLRWGLFFTLSLGLVAAALYNQPITLPLEYAFLALFWYVSVYFIHRVRRQHGKYFWATVLTVWVVILIGGVVDALWALSFGSGELEVWMLESFRFPGLWRFLARGGEILIAGLLIQAMHHWWSGSLGETYDEVLWQPAHWEPSFFNLYLVWVLPLTMGSWLLVSTLAIAQTQKQVQQQLREQLNSAAQNIDHQASFFIETGQLEITLLARQLVGSDQPEELQALMRSSFARSRFFHQLLLLDEQGQILAQVREPGQAAYPLSPQELQAISLLAQTPEVPYLEVMVTPALETSYVAFLTRLSARSSWFLLGRAWLNNHPQFEPVLWNLEYIQEALNGRGFLVDAHEQPVVLFPEDYTFVNLLQYEVLPQLDITNPPSEPVRPIRLSLGSARQVLVYQYPISGYSWNLVVLVPQEYLNQLTTQLNQVLLWWNAFAFIIILGIAGWALYQLTSSLKGLVHAAQELARGDLERPLPQGGVAEVQKLRESFEQMRQNLKRRLDELQQLLDVGRRLVTTLDWNLVVQPVLEGALYLPEAVTARVALSEDFHPPDLRPEAPRFFGQGPYSQLLAVLDEWLLQRLTDEDYREERLATLWRQLPTAPALPAALREAWVLFLPLWYRQQPIGVLYILFEHRSLHRDSLLRYYRALSEQLRLALFNARLFAQATTERQRLEAILWATPDAIFMTDNRLRVVMANRSARRLLGWPDDDQAYPREFEAPFAQDILLNMLLSTPEAPQSHEIVAPDGRVFFVTVAPVKVHGRQVGMVGILRDITHLKRAEVTRLEFVMGISHDLRSPLAQIQGYATLLERAGELNEKQRLYVQKIRDAVRQIHTMVDNLLELGRIDMGIQPQWELIPVAEMVASEVRSFEFRAQQKGITLEYHVDPNTPVFIEADPALLQRALRNLLDNALKFTPQGGRVTVRVKPKGRDKVLFIVEDTGIGIEPADRERLFERFFQAENARKVHLGGKGLGLAIVKSVVELHHGRVWVESQVGKGSRFYIELPRTPSRVDRERPPQTASAPTSGV